MISKTCTRKGAQGAQFSGVIIKNKESSVMPNVHLVFVISFAYDQTRLGTLTFFLPLSSNLFQLLENLAQL